MASGFNSPKTLNNYGTHVYKELVFTKKVHAHKHTQFHTHIHTHILQHTGHIGSSDYGQADVSYTHP